MRVEAVIYTPSSFSDELYLKALSLVDEESRTRIKKFYHRVDSCRTLIGRLLVRVMLKERGVSPLQTTFARTTAGKPFIANQILEPPIAYNITHDNNLVAMVVAPGTHNPPAFSIGIDVMKLRIPGRETLRSFINTVGDQLTILEHQLLRPLVSEDELLKRFFWMWTLKEAYTKALGLGLGFDFSRIEFDVINKIVKVDGNIPEGWRFNMFMINDGEDAYEGVVAEYVGGIPTEVIEGDSKDWLRVYDAVAFTESAINMLKHSGNPTQ
ncbi:4'-phosphopantetheinyl transferase [Pholiota conissans]|uniref:holo-[acyl-carrier-protein] synthase n=1 Tax=Pholiota conissans TaxID=109636 RepID=A0A9P5ZDY8_9AGAR|nr:4'-phosphopantetheinyl transferase [Pholiota conissans]